MPADLKDTDMLDAAWGLIANAGGGDWSTQTPEWQKAAARWRDRYCTPTMHDAPPAPKSQLELDLEHDAAGRVERTARNL